MVTGDTTGDWFGSTLSLDASGTVLAVGATQADLLPSVVYVKIYRYTNENNDWNIYGPIVGLEDYGQAGLVYINPSGNIIIIGSNCQRVKVFKYDQIEDTWLQLGPTIEGFGLSVIINNDGTMIFISQISYDNLRGKIFVYQYNENTNEWIDMNIVTLQGQNENDLFGYSLSLNDNGTILAVGAISYNGLKKGYTIVFEYKDGAWSQLGDIIEGVNIGDNCGYSVSLNVSGTRVAVGSHSYDIQGTPNIGQTRVFQYDSDNARWTQVLFDTILIADICFPKGTPIETDQGPVDIDLIDPKVHTMNQGDRIIAVTRTLSHDPWLVRIPKGLLGNGLPTRDTVISKNHKVMHEGRATRAIDLEGIAKTPYNPGDTLYNLLLEYHSGMMVNGLLVETLDPDDIVAQVFKVKDTPLYNQCIQHLNSLIKVK